LPSKNQAQRRRLVPPRGPLRALAGMSHEQIRADYPGLTEDNIRACLAYAAEREWRLIVSA
jgi:uncharacterized protein (DUF433 family)